MKFAFNLSIICWFFIIVVAQLGNVYEIYELSNGNLRPVANTPATTPRYSNNMFLNNIRGGNRNDQVKYDGVMIVMEILDCSSFWTIQNDYSTGLWGQLAIPSTDNSKAILRVVLSVASRLPSVS